MMVKARPPMKSQRGWKDSAVWIFVALIRVLFAFFLIVSGAIVIARYVDVILGNPQTEIQKVALDYSITVFAGTAAFFLLYHYTFEEIVRELLGVKKSWRNKRG